MKENKKIIQFRSIPLIRAGYNDRRFYATNSTRKKLILLFLRTHNNGWFDNKSFRERISVQPTDYVLYLQLITISTLYFTIL